MISMEVIINLIANTTTEKWLKVKAKVDEQQYNKGIKITDEQMKELNINRNDFRGKWNYIIYPKLWMLFIDSYLDVSFGEDDAKICN